MSGDKFDVTFIRGPRDVTPWKQAARRLNLLTNSPQNDEDALRARTAFREKRDGFRPEQYPNAIYQEKGRNRKCTK
ncbi:hypothetical protein [Tumebacillus flagellatus]|uniref:Uncharacterized protein n=1 Tax=Tumebacillus flagellatus TaxID=1157490 RepID=A0A074M8R1_9BACL|nr:hypothetical protein [Tumebacillus flagellatus]KEO82367.1 hypothetical protein EL26_15695 [Tumebacillus flagellatus]